MKENKNKTDLFCILLDLHYLCTQYQLKPQ